MESENYGSSLVYQQYVFQMFIIKLEYLKAFLHSFSVKIMVGFLGQFAFSAKAGSRVEKTISLRTRRPAVYCFSSHLYSLGHHFFICNVRVLN